MKMRRLGASELDLPVVTFGAWAIGGWQWGGTDDDAARAAIGAALDAGTTAIDTAPVYGFGHSERVVGAALAGRRDEALVLTKAGLRWDDERGPLAFEGRDHLGHPRRVHRNSRPDSVRFEVEESLRRLGTDRIDLLQIHWPDPTTPIAETMGELLRLRAEGKVREIGVSNYTPEEMGEARAALGDVPLASDQPRYSLVRREIEADVLPYAREAGVGLIVYSPLEQGLLTGKVPADRDFPETDGRHGRPTFRISNRALVNATLREVVQPVADARGATLAQVALAWVLAQPGVTSVIAGARDPGQARENAAAGELELAPGDIATIGRAFAELALDLEP